MNPAMMNKIRKMQKDMEEAQAKIEASEFIGKASGVTVIVLGNKQVIDVKISPELLEEVEMLQDAILLAVNDGLNQIEKTTQEVMSQFTSGMGGFGF